MTNGLTKRTLSHLVTLVFSLFFASAFPANAVAPLHDWSFSKEAINRLMDYPWTGNIRELRNVVERLMILGSNPITEDDIERFASKPNS